MDESQRHLVVACGFLVGELRGRLIAGAARIGHRLVGHPCRCRGEEVPRQLGKVGLEIGGVDRLERLTGLLVQLQPPRPGQLVVERVPDECVTEAKPARVIRARR